MNPSENIEFGQPITINDSVICQERSGDPDATRRSLKACFYIDDYDYIYNIVYNIIYLTASGLSPGGSGYTYRIYKCEITI
jgi:hypothetical protein